MREYSSEPSGERSHGTKHTDAGTSKYSGPLSSLVGMMGKLLWVWRWLWCVVVRNRFAIAIASLIWLIWRSGTQPRRLAYPCQQAAAGNLGVLAILFVPAIARRRKTRRGVWNTPVFQLATGSVALAGVLFVLVSAGTAVYSDYAAKYSSGNPAIHAWTPENVTSQAALSSRVFVPDGDEAVVAIERNTSTVYGAEPYGPGPNTAYDLIWKAVADLNLGTYENPLADFVSDMDADGVIRVHIKPNHVQQTDDIGGERSPGYTHPAAFRPLVDMLALAGANEITIGDATAVSDKEDYLTNTAPANGLTESYEAQLETIANNLPGVTQVVDVERVDMNNISYWSWVDLGADPGETGASSYYGSGIDESTMAKAHRDNTYFTRTDRHGQTGPGEANCMGWLAIPDYLLEADVVIDLAKLKVHYYGVTTAILKNWVGATMLHTYDAGTDWLGWCRVNHEKYNPSNYEKGFGNDHLWRDLADAHRSVIYWRDGQLYSTPQRKLLCVLDAICAAETYHFGHGNPQPTWRHTVVAGVNPVAVDAVGARVQVYDFRYVPIINNIHADSASSAWPVGTGDPGEVRIVGDTLIDSSFNDPFDFEDWFDSSNTWPEWGWLELDDIYPPVINSTQVDDLGGGVHRITADVSDAHVAFYYYGDDGTGAPKVVRMGKSGNTFSADLADAANGVVVAQDEYFNTAKTSIIFEPTIQLSTDELLQSAYYGQTPPTSSFTVSNAGTGLLVYSVTPDQTWMDVDPVGGDSAGEPDEIVVSYDVTGLSPGTYTGTITVEDPDASNPTETVAVTLVIETVTPDLDMDGDVDQADFGELQACLTGSNPVAGDCVKADLNDDDYVNGNDFSIMQGCMSGEHVIPDETCDD